MFDSMLSNMVVAWNPFSAIWEFIKQVEGWIMNVIFIFFQNVFHIQNIGLSIVFFTIVVYSLMLPMNYKQQKFSHMNKIMSPEINKIREKYKGKQDQESMMKQNEELLSVYSKYGVSPSGSCLQMIITLPIMFALYRIIYNVPAYVESVRNMYSTLVENIKATPDYATLLNDIGVRVAGSGGEMTDDMIHQLLYNFRSANWDVFAEKFSNISPDIIENTRNTVDNANRFLMLNIAESPSSTIGASLQNGFGGIFHGNTWLILLIALLIPLLSGLFQWLSVKAIPQAENTGADNMANTMKTMNTVMPLISVFFCFSLPLGVGIYWTCSSMYRYISNVIMNRRLNNMDMDAIVKKNLDKLNKKRAKQGLPPQKLTAAARINAKSAGNDTTAAKPQNTDKIRENVQKSTEYYRQNASNPGSISAKANMVKQYNEKNAKKKK